MDICTPLGGTSVHQLAEFSANCRRVAALELCCPELVADAEDGHRLLGLPGMWNGGDYPHPGWFGCQDGCQSRRPKRGPRLAGTAYRIRTGDLRLERAVSWASRRMRPCRRGRIRQAGRHDTSDAATPSAACQPRVIQPRRPRVSASHGSCWTEPMTAQPGPILLPPAYPGHAGPYSVIATVMVHTRA